MTLIRAVTTVDEPCDISIAVLPREVLIEVGAGLALSSQED